MLNIKNTFRIFPDEYKKKSLAFIIFLLIATVLETIGVGIIFPLIDIAIDGEISNNFINNNFSFILSKLEKKNLFQNLAILVILIYIFKSIYMLAFNFWQAKFQFSLYKFISEKFYYGYLHQSISFINKKNSSIILRNTMMECKNYAHLISLFLKLVVEITLALFIFSLVVLVDPQKTIMVSISIILLSSIYYSLTSGKLLRYSSERVETISDQVKILNESVSGIRDIKLKSSENFFINLYKLYIQKFVSAAYKQQFIIESPKIIIELIFILVFLIGLIFYINNNKEGEWSGIQDWDLVTFPVNAGFTEFKWKYDKDGGWSEGQDCAFIDYIIFPPIDLGSLSSENKDIDIKLFPNPTMGSFKVLFSDAKIRQANVYDVNGKLVFTKTSSDVINFDISEEKSGTYKIKILPEGITYLIVKK